MHLLKTKTKKTEYKTISIVQSCVVQGSKYIVTFHFYEMPMSAFKTLLYSHQPKWEQIKRFAYAEFPSSSEHWSYSGPELLPQYDKIDYFPD